jgi:SAM-dependent methyltransferase
MYDYELNGGVYSTTRRTDPRIARYIHRPLADARNVLNVGAGTGSYEPVDRYVIAVEPSAVMRAQRPTSLPPAVIAHAEALPFADRAFDASMAILTIHHWNDTYSGLREMRRVTKGPVVICTFDMDVVPEFWISDYAPEFVEVDRKRFPAIDAITTTRGGTCSVEAIPIPLDCVDGIQEAFYGRAEAFLNRAVRAGQSIWGCLSAGVEDRIVAHLANDLASGRWDARYGILRSQPEFNCALRVITSLPINFK